MKTMATMLNSSLLRVRQFALRQGLLSERGKYIVALSGGADSVAMLLMMNKLAPDLCMTVEAAHCNFHLRGAESDRDERFCQSLCSRLGIDLHVVHFATSDYAEAHHVSIEMAARDLRYGYFANLARDIDADGICVAHHRDDSVETVLLNLVRGTGIRGLRGILPKNGNIIRPMLCLSREDILQFLASEKQDYVTDSTNLVPDVKRNKLRLDVLPMLSKLNPSVKQTVFETSLRLAEALKVYDDAISRWADDAMMEGTSVADAEKPLVLSVDRLRLQPSPESTLHYVLSRRGFTSSHIEQIAAFEGKQSAVYSSSTHELCFDRGRLIIQPLGYGVHTKAMRLPEDGNYVYSDSLRISVKTTSIPDNFEPIRSSSCASLDACEVVMPLTVRPVANGDRFVPFGMNRSRLVSDYLTDRKKSLFEKRRQLVVTDANDTIVWVIGERTDNRFRIKSTTSKVLFLTIQIPKNTKER